MEKSDLFKVFALRMEWLGERQRLLAENVANASTPGYAPRDLKEGSFSSLLAGSAPEGPRRTAALHLTGTQPQPVASAEEITPYEQTPDGNGVVIEEQLVRMARAESEHELVTSLYAKYMRMFRLALGGGG